MYICPNALIKSLAHMFRASPRFSHQHNGIYKVIVSLNGRHASHLLTFSALQICRLHDFNKEVNKFVFGVVLLAFCLSLVELI